MLDRLLAAFLSIPGSWVVGAVFFLSAAETALFGYFAGEKFEALAHAMGWLGLALLGVVIAVVVGIPFSTPRARHGRQEK